MQSGDKPSWVSKIYFVLLLLVITTLLMSWMNINSYFVILTMLFLFVTENIPQKLREVFSNKLFLGYFALSVLELSGMLHADNMKIGWKNVESKATLVAIPFILLAGPFRGKNNYKKIMTAYCLLLFALSFISLCMAVEKYLNTKVADVLFYHDLVSPLKQNAILFTLFILAALLYLFSNNLYFGDNRQPGRNWRLLLIVYFIIYSIMLASKLLLFVLPVIFMFYLLQRFPARKRVKPLLAALLLVATGVIVLASTNNPIKKRYTDILQGDMDFVSQEKFTPDVYFNGVQWRLLEYRFAWEILNEKNAWVFGVSPGDSQDMLDAKYREADIYIGKGDLADPGYLGYDSHNQFLQHLLQSGIIGCLLLVVVCYMVLAQAVRNRSRELLFYFITFLLVSLVESMLELQHGLFLFSFFPFLFLYDLNNQHKTSGQG